MYIDSCRIIASQDNNVVGFALLSLASHRNIYRGVAEVTVYVDNDFEGIGIGRMLLQELIKQSEAHGFWTLQARIFSENISSINLHIKCGFRLLGIKEKIGQLNGKWHDNHFLERRSKKIN